MADPPTELLAETGCKVCFGEDGQAAKGGSRSFFTFFFETKAIYFGCQIGFLKSTVAQQGAPTQCLVEKD